MSYKKYKNCNINDPLSCFELYDSREVHLFDRLFLVILALSFLLAIIFGKYFQTIEPSGPGAASVRMAEQITAQFIINQPEPEPEPEVIKEEEVEKAVEKPEPIKRPELVQEAEPLPQEEIPQEQEPQRRVFGLERVHSSGLGAGGAMRDAVVGRIGNTLNAPVNDIAELRQEDLNVRGEIATVATITSKPSVRRMVRPQYTEEMIQNEVEGVVRVRVLVDIDGKVKAVEVLDDLGHGTSQAIIEASNKLEFTPAMRDGEPVAVWITIRFNLILK